MNGIRVYSIVYRNDFTGKETRRWCVEFADDVAAFATFPTATRFAEHIANGGNRWEFAV